MNRLTDLELEQQATTLRNNGQVDAAVKIYEELVGRFEKSRKKEHAAAMQHMIGVTYRVGNHTGKSLGALNDALERYEELKDAVGVGRVLRDKGITYQYARRYNEAKEFLEKSVIILQAANNVAELGISEVKFGNLLREVGVLDKSELWIERGIETLKLSDHWFYESTALLHRATLKLAQHKYNEALTAAEASEKLLRDNNGEQVQKRRLAQIWYTKAAIYRAMGELEESAQCREAGDSYAATLDVASKQYLREEYL